jgi:adenosylcobinamide hydrolase
VLGGEPDPLGSPMLASRREDRADLAVACWRFPVPLLAVTSAPYGGGLGRRAWVLNAQVAVGYHRTDPAGHVAELAGELGLDGPGVGMLTAVDVRGISTGREDGVSVAATVGLTDPAWAAAEDAGSPDHAGTAADTGPSTVAGTVNIIAALACRLTDAALVNAVMTVTEAKCQALWDAGLAATGTPTDAVCVLCVPAGPAELFGGPRSRWGSRLARATYRAVLAGSRKTAAQ